MAWLIPPPDRLGVRDPRSRVRMPATGREVDLSGPDAAFWRRCLRDGCVVEGKAPKVSDALVPVGGVMREDWQKVVATHKAVDAKSEPAAAAPVVSGPAPAPAGATS